MFPGALRPHKGVRTMFLQSILPKNAFLLTVVVILTRFSAGNAVLASDVLTGRVLSDVSREPIPGANIQLVGQTTGTMSDDYGNYSLSVEKLPVDLTVTHIAFQPRQIHIVLGGTHDIRLKPNVLSGQDILVTANRAISGQTPIAFTEIGVEDIKDNYNHQDVPMVLRESPGVYAYSDAGNGVGYTYVTIRGFKQDRIGVMLNGIPLNDPEAHAVYWVDHGDILASSGGIQIQRGVGNALYGAATFGGSINMVTEVQDLPAGVAVKTGYGNYLQSGPELSLPSLKMSMSYAGDAMVMGIPVAMYARISRLNSEGYRSGSGTGQYSGHLAMEWNSPKSSTRIEGFIGDEVTHFAWDGIAPAYGFDLTDRNDRRYNFYADPDYNGGLRAANKDVFQQWILSLKHIRQMGSGYLGTTIYHVDGNGYYEQYKGEDGADDLPDFLRLYHLLTVSGADTLTRAEIIRRKWLDNGYSGVISQYTINWGKLTSATGFDYRDYAAHHFGQVHEGLSAGISQIHDVTYYNDRTKKQSYTGFQHLVYQVTGNLSSLLNLRLHGHRYNMDQGVLGAFDGSHDFKLKYDFLDWQAGINYQITPKIASYMSVATSQREPSDGDIFSHDDPDTPPAVIIQSDSKYATALVDAEKLWDYEAGLNWHFAQFAFDFNMYWMDFKNELVPVDFRYSSGSDQILHANAEGTIHRGIEISARYNLSNRLIFSGNTTLSDSYFKSFQGDSLGWGGYGGIADYSGRKIPGSPAVMANLKLKGQFGWGDVWLSSQSVGKQYIDFMNREDAAIQGFTVLNCGARYQVPFFQSNQVVISLWLNNLTDKLYETFGYNYFNAPDERIDVYWPAATRNWFGEISVRF